MRENDYEYDYHNLAENAEFADDDIYYDDGTDEPWIHNDESNEASDIVDEYPNYYHNILEELED